MRTALLTLCIVLHGCLTIGYGQSRSIRIEETISRDRHMRRLADLAKAEREYKKRLETGRNLFGVDKRWGKKGEWAGTLGTKRLADSRLGDWGCTSNALRVVGKVSKTECLVTLAYGRSDAMLIRGLDMSKVTDGVEFILQHPIVIQSTYSYAAVSGAQKTVLVLERNEGKLKAAREKVGAMPFRKWADSAEKFTVMAKFIQYKSGSVHLEKSNGKLVRVSMSRLSRGDQKWVRNELRQRLKDKQKGAMR